MKQEIEFSFITAFSDSNSGCAAPALLRLSGRVSRLVASREGGKRSATGVSLTIYPASRLRSILRVAVASNLERVSTAQISRLANVDRKGDDSCGANPDEPWSHKSTERHDAPKAFPSLFASTPATSSCTLTHVCKYTIQSLSHLTRYPLLRTI